METIPEVQEEKQDLVYAIYNLSNHDIRFPVYSSLEEAKQQLELTIIYFFNDEINALEISLESVRQKLEDIRIKEKELLQKQKEEQKPKKVPAKKAPAKKVESESDSESSDSDSTNIYDSDGEYENWSKEELHVELAKLQSKKNKKYSILEDTRKILKIVSFTVLN